jgi:hypothetical protein
VWVGCLRRFASGWGVGAVYRPVIHPRPQYLNSRFGEVRMAGKKRHRKAKAEIEYGRARTRRLNKSIGNAMPPSA